MENNDDDLLSVRDLGLASALISLDHKTVGTRKDETGRVYFLFLKTTGALNVVDDYWANTLTVKARSYFDNTKMLKTRIYNEQ
jgi:hypothetical protein